MIPNEDIAHQTVTLLEWSGFWWSCWGFSSLQYRKFCLFTKPERWKCASSLIHRLWTRSSFSSNMSNNVWQKRRRAAKSFSFIAWTTWILYGWWCKSNLKILRTLVFAMPSAALCRRADLRGLLSTATLTRSIFAGVRTDLALPPLLLLVSPIASKFVTHNLIELTDGTGLFRLIWKFVRKRRWAAA